MDTGVSPHYLSSLILASVEDSTIYNLRNANNLRHTLTRTQLYYRSFLPSSIRAWNDLALEVRQSSSIQTFKYQLNKNLKRPPKCYYVGNRLSQIRHTRLRTDCSALNYHLFSKNIVDSPHSACGAVETTKHAQADLRLCWPLIPHCWKSHVAALIILPYDGVMFLSKHPKKMRHSSQDRLSFCNYFER